MASPAITRDDIAGWLASRPGLFESPTFRGVWGRAWRMTLETTVAAAEPRGFR